MRFWFFLFLAFLWTAFVMLLVAGAGWAVTNGVYWLLCLAFGWEFNWGVSCVLMFVAVVVIGLWNLLEDQFE